MAAKTLPENGDFVLREAGHSQDSETGAHPSVQPLFPLERLILGWWMGRMGFGWVSDLLLLTGWFKADEENTSQGDHFPKHHPVFLFQKEWDLPGMCQCSVFPLYHRGDRRLSRRGAEAMLAVPLKARASVLVPQWFLCQCFLWPQPPAPCALGEEPLHAVIDSVK